MSNNNGNHEGVVVRGSIVVVAKCPIPGKSKTRLIPLLGETGSVRLAKSMLSDVLKTIDGCSELEYVRKVLLYAPGDTEGLETMKTILDELGLTTYCSDQHRRGRRYHNSDWQLLPMLSSNGDNLRSNDLGAKLEDALVRVRELHSDSDGDDDGSCQQQHGVVFLGMDAPILPLDDIVEGLRKASSKSSSTKTKTKKEEDEDEEQPIATLCPAYDGGYAMLCVPPNADPSKTFLSSKQMHWSHPLTAISQLKALTDQNVKIHIGQIIRDIDEATDVQELCQFLKKKNNNSNSNKNDNKNDSDNDMNKNLDFPSGWSSSNDDDDDDDDVATTTTTTTTTKVTSRHPTCQFTRQALTEAGLFG